MSAGGAGDRDDPIRFEALGGDGGGRRGDAAPARLVLPPAIRRDVERGLEAAYPREGCGVLLGEEDGPDRRVTEIRPAENRWPERGDRGGRYLVAPGTLRRLMDREAEGGPRILGFYHSHPDADPVPSGTDRERAWPWYLYLIVPVRDGEAGAGRAWELEEADRRSGEGGDAEFVERPVVRPGAV